MSTIQTGLDYTRYEPAPADNGLLNWNYDPADTTNSDSPAAGVLNLSRLWVGQNMTISNMVVVLLTAGTGTTSLSGCYLTLYNSAGTLIGQSADQSSAWSTIGSGAPAAALTPTSTGSLALVAGTYVFAGILIAVQSTTAAQFGARAQGNAAVANAGIVNSSNQFTATPRSVTFNNSGSGYTTPPASITPMSGTPGLDYFFGLS